jgi:hypothetical protein
MLKRPPRGGRITPTRTHTAAQVERRRLEHWHWHVTAATPCAANARGRVVARTARTRAPTETRHYRRVAVAPAVPVCCCNCIRAAWCTRGGARLAAAAPSLLAPSPGDFLRRCRYTRPTPIVDTRTKWTRRCVLTEPFRGTVPWLKRARCASGPARPTVQWSRSGRSGGCSRPAAILCVVRGAGSPAPKLNSEFRPFLPFSCAGAFCRLLGGAAGRRGGSSAAQ